MEIKLRYKPGSTMLLKHINKCEDKQAFASGGETLTEGKQIGQFHKLISVRCQFYGFKPISKTWYE